MPESNARTPVAPHKANSLRFRLHSIPGYAYLQALRTAGEKIYPQISPPCPQLMGSIAVRFPVSGRNIEATGVGWL